jgi:hypothetical protein
MLALVAALGALYALALAVEPLRHFFEITPLAGGQLFLSLLSAAGGLVLASAIWRLPQIESLEHEVQEHSPPDEEQTPAGRMPAPTTAREAARAPQPAPPPPSSAPPPSSPPRPEEP